MEKSLQRRLSDLLKQGKVAEAQQLLAEAAETETQSASRKPRVAVKKSVGKTPPPKQPAPGSRNASLRDNHGTVITGNVTHQHMAPAGEDPAALLRAYLQRVWQLCNALALLTGSDKRRAVRLGSVYTALMTDVPVKDGAGKPDEMLRGGRQRMRSAVDMMDAEARLVILGGPGSGKSTLVNYVAQAMAGELLGDDAGAPEPNLRTLRAPLPREDDDDGKKPKLQPWRHGALMPVVVVLRDLAAQLPAPGQPVGAGQVWSYLADQLHLAGLEAAAAPLKAHLQAAGGLVMFDGLDEVPDAKTRREQVKQVVEDFARSHRLCRVLVTSRTYAYQNQAWMLDGFTQAPLSAFAPAQVKAFVSAWYAHMVALVRLSPTEAEARRDALLRQIERNPRVAELAQRPLLLTLFARLQTEGSTDLPEQREELYHASVKMLLIDWEGMKPGRAQAAEPEPSLSEWLRASQDDIRRELNRLAFEAHRDQADQQHMASIREADLLAALMRANRNPEARLGQLQVYLRDRAGILVEVGGETLQFPHRTFQEYLAACHLANDDYPDKLAALLRADPLRWREVTLLAAAHAARGNAEIPTWVLAEELCRTPLDADSPASEAWAALLAGQVVVAAQQHRGCKERNLSKLERVRGAQLTLLCGRHLPPVERALAGRTLAALGDSRPEVSTLAGMQFCWVPPGRFTMGDDGYSEVERPQHEVDMPYGYAIARFPVTVAQWQEYLRAACTEGTPQPGPANGPASLVSFHEAVAFCQHLQVVWAEQLPTGWWVDLPTEAEWEKAARGGHRLPPLGQCVPFGLSELSERVTVARLTRINDQPARRWPWSNEWGDACANAREAGIGEACAVGAFPAGASPYGCEELAGNVWEWSRSLWGSDILKPEFGYPYQPADRQREALDAGLEIRRLACGGSFLGIADDACCAARVRVTPDTRGEGLGFRVVLRSPPVW